jgi:integrase
VADLSARGLAPATVQKAYQLLGKVMGGAVDAGMLAQSPCRRVPLPKVEQEEMRFLTPAEVAALAGAIAPRYRALVLVGADGGLRIGELARLPRFVVEELAAHLAEPGHPDDLVFTAPQGGPLRVIAFRARIWRPATRNSGLDGLRIHDLRHGRRPVGRGRRQP